MLARPARLLGVEPFFMEFIAGIDQTLSGRDLSVLLHIVDTHDAEIEAYRRWSGRGLVDAVVTVNLVRGDRRPAVLSALGLPSLLVGNVQSDLPTLRSDDAGALRTALGHLLGLGHRRIARVTGPADLLHTEERTVTLLGQCSAAGIVPVVLEGDYSTEAGEALTRELLGRPDRPTAILYDNDVMAVAGLRAAQDAGVSVPAELSLLAWDDSALCRLTSPALTTMSVDVHEYGRRVADSVLELIDGVPVTERSAPPARLTARESTGPAPDISPTAGAPSASGADEAPPHDGAVPVAAARD